MLSALGGGSRRVLGQISLPYRLAAIVVAVAVFGGWCYLRGAQSAEQAHYEQLSESLRAQLRRVQALNARDLTAALELADREVQIVTQINEVRVPGSLCEPRGVREYRAAVRIAGGSTGRADAAAAGSE